MSRKQDGDSQVRVLCAVCSQFFDTPRCCLELADWNVCAACSQREEEETRAILTARGIVLPWFRQPNPS